MTLSLMDMEKNKRNIGRLISILLLALLAGAVSLWLWLFAANRRAEEIAGRTSENRSRRAAAQLRELLMGYEAATGTGGGAAMNPFAPPNSPPEEPEAPVPSPPPPPPSPPSPPPVQMTGWVKLQGIDYALVSVPGEPERYVQLGDDISGWQITQVTRESIMLTKDGHTVVIPLKESFSVTPLRRQ